MKNFSTEQGCCACGMSGKDATCLHHLYTRKARPELQYSSFNLIPVCQSCHVKFHSLGTSYMANTYRGVGDWLRKNGWEFNLFLSKWVHPRAFKQPECHEEEVGGD